MNRINPILLILSISILQGGGDISPGKDIQTQLNHSEDVSVSAQKGLAPGNGQKPKADRQEEMESFREKMEQQHGEMINQMPAIGPRLKQALNQKSEKMNQSSSFDPEKFKRKMKSNSRSDQPRKPRN